MTPTSAAVRSMSVRLSSATAGLQRRKAAISSARACPAVSGLHLEREIVLAVSGSLSWCLTTASRSPSACCTASEKLESLLNQSAGREKMTASRPLLSSSTPAASTAETSPPPPPPRPLAPDRRSSSSPLVRARRTSISMLSPMSISILRRRDTTCSRVRAVRLRERRACSTSVPSSTAEESISRPVSGGKRTSLSWVYCESHERSAPLSTRPICISKTVDAAPWA
mmetsp:Transcript_53191/g.119412  ORF Transcript_53191/g.119412 Transcript_53191/m.119412 type:complete len:226 (+) Transcript_53191:1519-2196(+)